MAELLKKISDEVFNRLRHIFRIRKLTPTETMRLMGMTDDDVAKMRAVGVSNSQIYKISGNGLVTNCVQYQMEHLYKCLVDNDYETTDEKMVREGYGV